MSWPTGHWTLQLLQASDRRAALGQATADILTFAHISVSSSPTMPTASGRGLDPKRHQASAHLAALSSTRARLACPQLPAELDLRGAPPVPGLHMASRLGHVRCGALPCPASANSLPVRSCRETGVRTLTQQLAFVCMNPEV
jgi:hypothetical protein